MSVDDVSYTDKLKKMQKLMQYSLYFKAVNTAFTFSVYMQFPLKYYVCLKDQSLQDSTKKQSCLGGEVT